MSSHQASFATKSDPLRPGFGASVLGLGPMGGLVEGLALPSLKRSSSDILQLLALLAANWDAKTPAASGKEKETPQKGRNVHHCRAEQILRSAEQIRNVLADLS